MSNAKEVVRGSRIKWQGSIWQVEYRWAVHRKHDTQDAEFKMRLVEPSDQIRDSHDLISRCGSDKTLMSVGRVCRNDAIVRGWQELHDPAYGLEVL